MRANFTYADVRTAGYDDPELVWGDLAMRRRLVLLMCVSVACGNVNNRQSDAQEIDGTAMADSAEPIAICDPTTAFDAPEPLTGFNTPSTEGTERLTIDELELYFSGALAGASSSTIYRAQRSTISQPFGLPVPLTSLHMTAGEYDPSVSSDALTLYFQSPRVPNQGDHLYVSTRTSRAGEFGAPSELLNVNSMIVTDNDFQPSVTIDGQELWFVSDRAGGLGLADIYRATWNGSSFGSVTAVNELNSSAKEWLPILSADKLTIYFASDRADGKGGFDIWSTHRATVADGFPPPRPVSELNSSASEFAGWLSPDNCRIYFHSDRAGNYDIYIATRHAM